MSNKILASAIGTICAQYQGLFRLVLPRSLSPAFKKQVCLALKEANGVPVPVGDSEGEYSAGEAIAFRTPEDGSVNKAIVLIATDGQARELKSLETFRDLLASGMPGGLSSFSPAILRLNDMSSEIAQQLACCTGRSLDTRKLSHALNCTLSYLAEAYRSAGNDEKRWTDAYWQHADMLVDCLPKSILKMQAGKPEFERDVVFASAGLPKPDGPNSFAARNDSKIYARIVTKSWSSQQEIDRSLDEIDQIDSEGTRSHPLLSIGWQNFPNTRTNLGHPLLAVAYHGSDNDDEYIWFHGWASTSENAFFSKRNRKQQKYELYSLSEDEDLKILPPLGWQGLDHILPPGPKFLHCNNRISLGKFRLSLITDIDLSGQPIPITLHVQPVSSCTADVFSYDAGDGFFHINFELWRRASTKGGKWREKPFTLSVLPFNSAPGLSIFNGLSLKLCAPHPARPTAIAVEQKSKHKKLVPSFPVDGRYEIDTRTGEISFDHNDQDISLLKLQDGSASAMLAVVGSSMGASWVGGKNLVRLNRASPDTILQLYDLTPLPEDAVIELDEYKVDVQASVELSGQVNPIFASVLGQRVIPADNDLHTELRSDPRGLLEEWYQENYITVQHSHAKDCLGTCVIETSGQGNMCLKWNSAIGTFANTINEFLNLKFPVELAVSPEASAFWEAFKDLELGAYGGTQQVSAWPSALDLRDVSKDQIDHYLLTFCDLLKTIDEPRIHSWLAYPFSALLFNQGVGEAEGVLLSPLHPLRLAWNWSVQQASDEVSQSKVFGQIASSFLRFVDGELLPLSGPATHSSERWVSTGLAPGPEDFFAGWSLLAGTSVSDRNAGTPIRLMGLSLPFGTPSGLDHGGVAAALRDYMRIYPASPEIRIGLTAPRGAERYPETDEAIIAASSELIALFGEKRPGGVRIFDASNRKGRPPSPTKVLRKILPGGMDLKDPASHPPFEWSTEAAKKSTSKADIQFIEDTVVRIRIEGISEGNKTIGTSGPTLPFNRYRSWSNDGLVNGESSFALGLQESSFEKLPSFAHALRQIENLKVTGTGLKLTASLRLGADLLGDQARWTITGNRHLDPSTLSSQLHAAPGNLTLWEWRPAFLSRQKQSGIKTSVASTHPYTVLARPSPALTDEVASNLQKCGMVSKPNDVHKVIKSLGLRGVGLSSLLTMGHTQSMGAMGFSLAFRALQYWEMNTEPEEVRCIVPMDAIYPLLDVLSGEGTDIDDQRRADLLLMSARIATKDQCSLHFHPVEVKMRSGAPGTFPKRNSTRLDDPLEQLSSTHRILEKICQIHTDEGYKLSLSNAALAALLEAALSLRPASSTRQIPQETRLLGAFASGAVTLTTSSGTLLWFQANATGIGGGLYEKRSPSNRESGQVYINPALLDDKISRDEITEVVATIVNENQLFTDTRDGKRQSWSEHKESNLPGREESQPDINIPANNDHRAQRQTKDPQPQVRNNIRKEVSTKVESLTPEGISILVGSTPSGATTSPVFFNPSETALNQLNIGVVGDLGTGKTQLLKSLVYQLSMSAASNRGHPPKVFIFDYKRDYTEGDFPEALGIKILDPSKKPLPINFFALGVDPEEQRAVRIERVRRSNFFCDLLRRISGIGQVQRNNLYTCVMKAYEACAHGHAPSINDVYDIYGSLGKSDSVVSVLTLMRDLMIFEPNPQNTTTFVNLFDGSTVLNLSGLGGAGQDIVDIVATMFLDNLYTDYMKQLPKEDFIDGSDGVNRRKVDSFVLIDEAHHAMERDFDVLMKLMLEGREFGMGVILSSQFLSHFDAGKHDWAQALSTWIVHNVRNANTRQFENIGFRGNISNMVQNIAGLETHWAYYRCINGYNEGILIKGQPYYSLDKTRS